MKYIKSIVLLIVCFGVVLGITSSCKNKTTPLHEKIEYIYVRDSARIKELETVLQLTRDSLNVYKNDTSMTETEFVLRYKLERIRYYNELAGKGNNAKFIRGWINRVINE